LSAILKRPVKNISSFIAVALLALVLGFLPVKNGAASSDDVHGLPLSGMQVTITAGGHTATFGLYDTASARQFYAQLPFKLDLSNFRDAQWMFYPPERLNVTTNEAYHDGKKGDLSYYAPWGDVFILYKDFHAGDEMHRLGVGLAGVEEIASMSGLATIEKKAQQLSTGNNPAMEIQVTANGNITVFRLNDSPAAQALYAQLPLTVEVEDYGGKEKIFYPPQKLDTANTPRAHAKAGSLSYYAPWGDVVLFYKNFGSASGLYELGEAISGIEYIQAMSGTIQIEVKQ
jgi:hypothetical protein